MPMKKRLQAINLELKKRCYIDSRYINGLLSERAMILALDRDLPTSFSFGL
jgi:hypothetical protein